MPFNPEIKIQTKNNTFQKIYLKLKIQNMDKKKCVIHKIRLGNIMKKNIHNI